MSIQRKEISLSVQGKKTQAFFYRDHSPDLKPGVLLFTDIKGIRPVYHESAERLAQEGFAVLMPNVFFRSGQLPVFDFPFQIGEERTMKRMHQLMADLGPDAQMSDISFYLDALRKQEGVRRERFGVLGYCYTGAMSIRAAAACENEISAAASFHGGNLFTETPTSPHLLLSKVRAALFFGHAADDKSMPTEAIAKLEQALKSWGGKFTNKIYEGALHGWTNSDSPIYNETQAKTAFQELTAFFQANLA